MYRHTLRLIASGLTRERWRFRKRHFTRSKLEPDPEHRHFAHDRRARHRHRRRMLRQLHRGLLRSYP
jgi:hypothetical protein